MMIRVNLFLQLALELRGLLYRKRSKRINGMRVMRMKRRQGLPRRYRMLVPCLFLSIPVILSQELAYDNFEGRKVVSYNERSGVLDTAVQNPGKNAVNSSEKCALYIRNSAKKFDNIKMRFNGTLAGVEKYATHEGEPPRLRIKVLTEAPPGTLVEVLLGSKDGNNAYPAGTHSQYQAYTTVSNEWEELVFKFSQVPQGSETPATKVDQVTLLFNPNSATSDKYYFDELTGPSLAPGGPELIAEPDKEIKAPAETRKKKTKKITKN